MPSRRRESDPPPGRPSSDSSVPTTRRVVFIACVCGLLLGAVPSLAFSLLVSVSVRDDAEKNAVAGCKRGNAIRHESNARIKAHAKDVKNLLALAAALGRTRDVERAVFADFEAQGKAVQAAGKADSQTARSLRNIHKLTVTYDQAAAADARILESEMKIKFKPLRRVDCDTEAVAELRGGRGRR